jgi:hypothetical protein
MQYFQEKRYQPSVIQKVNKLYDFNIYAKKHYEIYLVIKADRPFPLKIVFRKTVKTNMPDKNEL